MSKKDEKREKLDEVVISKAIVENFMKDFLDFLEVDVAIVGAGPSGMIAGYYLAKEGKKVAIFERKLSIGGGMWGGGMMYNRCVFQEVSRSILDEIGVRMSMYQKGYYTTDSLETVSCLCLMAIKAGARIFNLMSVEDVVVRENRVSGLVINWSAAYLSKLHVDPICLRAKYVLDATGHDAEIVRIITRKIGGKLFTSTGDLLGEKPMWAELGEESILDNTREVYPHLYVAGMAANAVYGGPRMGPIFGGMLLSGQKAAKLILDALA